MKNKQKKDINYYLTKLVKLERRKYHPLVHKVHRKHNISKKTLFYIREYGPHSHIPRVIIKESIKVLLLASIISSIGGLAFENIKDIFISLIPIIILFPALNGLIGGFGGIVSSKFASMLHEGKAIGSLLKSRELKTLLIQILIISTITTSLSALVSLVLSQFSSYSLNFDIALKVFLIAIIDSTILVMALFFIAIKAGIYLFKKKEDPNNFLIPITTAIADFGNMIILSFLIILFF